MKLVNQYTSKNPCLTSLLTHCFSSAVLSLRKSEGLATAKIIYRRVATFFKKNSRYVYLLWFA